MNNKKKMPKEPVEVIVYELVLPDDWILVELPGIYSPTDSNQDFELPF